VIIVAIRVGGVREGGWGGWPGLAGASLPVPPGLSAKFGGPAPNSNSHHSPRILFHRNPPLRSVSLIWNPFAHYPDLAPKSLKVEIRTSSTASFFSFLDY
jgi:hypothetical protein